jgi:hypothetical protein
LSERRRGDTDALLVQAFARLDKTALGVAAGVLCGLAVFTATVLLVVKGGEVVGPNLALLAQYFVGYTVTWAGAFVGLLYGCLLGFILGFLVALFRNLVVAVYTRTIRAKAELSSLTDFLDHL